MTAKSKPLRLTRVPCPVIQAPVTLGLMAAIRFVEASVLRLLNHLICQDDKYGGFIRSVVPE
jgi:hypothetical protein